jgi:hypothetical protein
VILHEHNERPEASPIVGFEHLNIVSLAVNAQEINLLCRGQVLFED